jgi:hypothetical protein
MSRFLVASCLAAVLSVPALASPLHSSDPNYRGAFTVLAAGRLQGATARYSTEVWLTNNSGHDVFLRLELYPTSGGYREAVFDLNAIPTGLGSGFRWGWINRGLDPTGLPPGEGPDTTTTLLGDNLMGALRVVAIHKDGTEDPTADISGFARLWIEPNTGGRMSELQPTFTDYQLGGDKRAQLTPTMPDIMIYRPFDVTGARYALVVTNFDREHAATFTIGERDATDVFGKHDHADAIDVDVPAGESRRVPLTAVGPENFQTLTVKAPTGDHFWYAYVSVADNTTSDSQIRFDAVTENQLTRW